MVTPAREPGNAGTATPSPPTRRSAGGTPSGLLDLHRETLELPAGDAQQLVVLLPATGATGDALAQLRHHAAPPLRAVN